VKLELSEPQLSVSELGHHQQQVAEWRLSADNLHWDVATGRQMATGRKAVEAIWARRGPHKTEYTEKCGFHPENSTFNIFNLTLNWGWYVMNEH